MGSKGIIGLGLLAICSFGGAQDGHSTAGAAQTKYLSSLGILPRSRDVVVEDFINYPRHEIRRPKAGENVALEVRWDKAGLYKEGVVQVGISTTLSNDKTQLRPLNLSLVIDKSGSMNGSNKMDRVKSALLAFASELRPTDTLSITTFDTGATVLLGATKVGDGTKIRDMINGIRPGGSTNLHAGLILGYKEAEKFYNKNSTNRVILLTDGIANVGVVDIEQIAKESQAYNDKGIDVSTIGVGQDLNRDLLYDLAKSGRGLSHFIGDDEDINKVFKKEAQSLMSPVALQPKLTIDFGPNLEFISSYGYSPVRDGSKANFDIDNLNSGSTQIILVRVRPKTKQIGTPITVSSKLSFYDVDKKSTSSITDSSSVKVVASQSEAGTPDSSLRKHLAIARLAEGIRQMAVDCEGKQYREAEQSLKVIVDSVNKEFPSKADADILRPLQIAEKYVSVLREKNQTEYETEGFGENIIVNGDFSLGNQGFSTPLAYVKPEANILWDKPYTLAPRFDQPQLHRLIANQPFFPPKRPTGNEKAFFSNLGGTDTMEVISFNAKCQPNTEYMVRCQAISLTPGREWVPTLELRVNGDRSEPQAAGELVYKQIEFVWKSGSSRSCNIQLMRMAIPHGGGIVGFANFEMREFKKG